MKIKNALLLSLCWISVLLRTIWLFFPTLLFLVFGAFIFWSLPQGSDIIRLCLSSDRIAGAVFIVALIFWVFVTWYTARLIAYNHEELFHAVYTSKANDKHPIRIGQGLMYHFPRLMAYSIFIVINLSILQYDHVGEGYRWIWWAGILFSFAVYALLHFWIVRLQAFAFNSNSQRKLVRLRNLIWTLVISCWLIAISFWSEANRTLIVVVLSCFQFGFLFLVITRRDIAKWKSMQHVERKPFFLQRYLDWVLNPGHGEAIEGMRDIADSERFTFVLFNSFALVGVTVYVLCILKLQVALSITPMPFVLLAFAVLLCFGNFVSLISHRNRINIHFLLLCIVFIAGFFTEPHPARIISDPYVNFSKRMDLDTYMHYWLNAPERREKILASDHYPVFIVLADGGASRSGYWTALVLGYLTAKTDTGAQPFRQHLLCLSGASGGSVGHGAYLAALSHQDSSTRNYPTLKARMTGLLGNDLLTYTLARMLGTDIAAPIFAPIIGDRAYALEYSLEHADERELLSKDMQSGFSHFTPNVMDNHTLYPIVCFNITRMQDGRPGVISNIMLDSARFGERLDMLSMLDTGQDIRLSTAMIMSARFPYISPAGRVANSYFVDGGYFDNSGAGVAHEMLQGLQKMRESKTRNPDMALLRRLRFYVLHITNSPYSHAKLTKVHPVENDLLAPLLTLAGSYSTQTSVNDTRLSRYIDDLNGEPSFINISPYLANSNESLPMDWVISQKIRNVMDDRVEKIPELQALVARLNKPEHPPLFQNFAPNSAPNPETSEKMNQKGTVKPEDKKDEPAKKDTAAPPPVQRKS